MTDAKLYTRGDTKLRIYRYTKTGALFLSWICLGLYNEVIGPTLPDLKDRIGCNYEEISRVLSARSAGLFIGSVSGGVLHDRWPRYRDLFLTIALLLSALTITIAPWCPTLWSLGIVFHVMGHSHALLTTGGNPTIAILWADQSDGPYNFLHSGFGLGAIIGPLISNPFMSDYISHDSISFNNSNNITSVITTRQVTSIFNSSLGDFLDQNLTVNYMNESMKWSNSTVTQVVKQLNVTGSDFDSLWSDEANSISGRSRIEYPYAIVGICCAVVASIFFTYFMSATPAPFVLKKAKWVDIINPRTCAGGQTTFGLKMLALIFLYYMFVVGGERAFGKFVFSYAIESKLQLSKTEAGWLIVMYWISFTVARVLVFIVSRWVPIHILLFIEIVGTLASAILLDIFAENVLGIWVLTMTFGFFKSPLFPSCLGWANHYITLNSMTITLVNLGSSTGGMLVQWLTGYMFEYYGPQSFLHIIVAYATAIFLVSLVMYYVATQQGDRFVQKELNSSKHQHIKTNMCDVQTSERLETTKL